MLSMVDCTAARREVKFEAMTCLSSRVRRADEQGETSETKATYVENGLLCFGDGVTPVKYARWQYERRSQSFRDIRR